MSCRNIVLLNSAVMEAEASDVINWHRNVVRLEERVRVVDGHLTFIDGKHGTGDASIEAGGGTKTDNDTNETMSVAGREDPVSASGSTSSTETSDYDLYDSDDSVEDEDDGEVDTIKKMRGQEPDNDEDTYDRSNDLRYEISQWPYHFRQADSLWSEEEKAGSQQWTELKTELDKFAIDNVRAFELWQHCVEQGEYLQQGVGPLHVAANLGLTYWARHLVEIRGMDPSVFSGGRNALQAAAISADSHDGRDVLGFLLNTPGAEPSVQAIRMNLLLYRNGCPGILAKRQFNCSSTVMFTSPTLYYISLRQAKPLTRVLSSLSSTVTAQRSDHDWTSTQKTLAETRLCIF